MPTLILALCLLCGAGNILTSSAFVPKHALLTRPPLQLHANRYNPDIPRSEENGEGDFGTEVLLPVLRDDESVRGVVFFMHGFSQYPKAYRKSLEVIADEAKVAVIGVETGTLSSEVVKDIVKGKGKDSAQYVLQKSVSEDTEQCIKMVKENDEIFTSLGVPDGGDLPMGLVGHSMGGGLCFYVAEKFNIDHVFVMAPVAGEEEFKPESAIKIRAPKQSMFLAGNWDIIAKPRLIKKMSDQCKSKNVNDSDSASLYVEINRGIHTGFEDKLVLFNIDLIKATSLVFKILGVAELAVSLAGAIFSFFRTKTGQIEITRSLLSYFMVTMVDGGGISNEGASEALQNDPDMKDSFVDKVKIID